MDDIETAGAKLIAQLEQAQRDIEAKLVDIGPVPSSATVKSDTLTMTVDVFGDVRVLDLVDGAQRKGLTALEESIIDAHRAAMTALETRDEISAKPGMKITFDVHEIDMRIDVPAISQVTTVDALEHLVRDVQRTAQASLDRAQRLAASVFRAKTDAGDIAVQGDSTVIEINLRDNVRRMSTDDASRSIHDLITQGFQQLKEQ